MRRVLRWFARLLLALASWLVLVALAVWAFGEWRPRDEADAAVVLGAAVAAGVPTPVFAARLDHGINLYNSGKVRWLVLTGGVGSKDLLSESEAGAIYAMARGVPQGAILMEKVSHTTLQNLTEVLPVMQAAGIRTCLLVSDPLHLLRANWMAHDLGLDCRPSATPTSRYLSAGTRFEFLKREMYFLHHYAVWGE